MLPHKNQSQEQNYFLKVPKNPIPQSEKLNDQKKTLTDCTENYPFFQQNKNKSSNRHITKTSHTIKKMKTSFIKTSNNLKITNDETTETIKISQIIVSTRNF